MTTECEPLSPQVRDWPASSCDVSSEVQSVTTDEGSCGLSLMDRRPTPPWWGVPELFTVVIQYLNPEELRVVAGVGSYWAYNAERVLSVHVMAGDALQRRTELADQLLEDFVESLHCLVVEVADDPPTVPSLTLRVHASRAAEECRIAQTNLRTVMASGDGCDGLCSKMVRVATARRDVCAGILSYTQRLQREARAALRRSEEAYAQLRSCSVDPMLLPDDSSSCYDLDSRDEEDQPLAGEQ